MLYTEVCSASPDERTGDLPVPAFTRYMTLRLLRSKRVNWIFSKDVSRMAIFCSCGITYYLS